MKVVLVTGAARRIGAAIVKLLHKNNYNIVLHCNHSQSAADKLAAELNHVRANSVCVISQDLHDISQIENLVKKAVNCWGKLDVVVNNASNFFSTPFGKITLQQWEELQRVNVQAPFFLCQAAQSYLQYTKGCIVNIADIHGSIPMKDHSVYCIAKAGLIMMTKSLAKEMAPVVRVNAVAPGAMLWPEGENTLSDELKEKIKEKTYLKCTGEPQDIAQAVLYFLQAPYVTGQILAVDAGRSAG